MQTPLLRPFLRILTMIRAVFGGYLLAAVVMSLAVSLINLAGFLLMKVEFAAIIAATMGVLDFLPYVGSGLVLIPWCVYCFAVGQSGRALGLIVIYAAVFVLRNVVGRRLLGARYQHNSFFLLICVFIGWKLGGIGGVILGQMFGMMLANVYRNGKMCIRDRALGAIADNCDLFALQDGDITVFFVIHSCHFHIILSTCDRLSPMIASCFSICNCISL